MDFKNLINQAIVRLLEVSNNVDSMEASSQVVIGLALWDIFSNNNTAVNSIGSEIDLGSWREAAGSIANAINAHGNGDFDFSDFFQGTQASDLKPVDQLDNYTEIFLLLHELGWDWISGTAIEYAVCVMDPFTVQAYKSVYKK